MNMCLGVRFEMMFIYRLASNMRPSSGHNLAALRKLMKDCTIQKNLPNEIGKLEKKFYIILTHIKWKWGPSALPFGSKLGRTVFHLV